MSRSVTTIKNYNLLPTFQISVSLQTQNKQKARSVWGVMLQIHHKYIQDTFNPK